MKDLLHPFATIGLMIGFYLGTIWILNLIADNYPKVLISWYTPLAAWTVLTFVYAIVAWMIRNYKK